MTVPIDLTVKGDTNEWGLPAKECYIHTNTDLLPELVAEYVRLIELENTNRICSCEWIVHPDDENKPEGERRVRKGEPSMDCPVHTKEGFLIGFFRWMLARGDSPIGAPMTSAKELPPISEELVKKLEDLSTFTHIIMESND